MCFSFGYIDLDTLVGHLEAFLQKKWIDFLTLRIFFLVVWNSPTEQKSP